MLKTKLNKEMSNDFTDITKEKNPNEFEKRIDTIVSWAAEEKTLTKNESMKRLIDIRVKEERASDLADLMVFDYFRQAKWTTADTFNISIGQGENQYSPAQMARYVAAIANGGDLVDLSVIDRTISSDYSSVYIDENNKTKIKFNNSENLQELKKGMVRVTTDGSAKGIFSNFPVSVAAKTGTAEKSGKIPTSNEYKYLLSHMNAYNVSTEEAIKLSNKLKKEREDELSKERTEEIKLELKDKDLDDKKRKELEEELQEGVKVKLEDNDKINASYLRKAIKELNPKITDDKIDEFKQSYDSFAWSVGFAPADNPEIAVVSMIPQGSSSTYAMVQVRELIGAYLGVEGKNKSIKQEDTNEDKNNQNINKFINFSSQMKK